MACFASIAFVATGPLQAGPNYLWSYGSGSWGASGRVGYPGDNVAAVGKDGTIYVISDDRRIRAITPSDTGGTHKWVSSTTQVSGLAGIPESSVSVAHNGTIWMTLVYASSGFIHAINPSNGSVIKTENLGHLKDTLGAPAIGINDWSYTAFEDCVVAMRPDGSTFAKDWAFFVPNGYRISTMPAVSEHWITQGGGVTTTNQNIYWVETDDDPNQTLNNRIYARKQQQDSSGNFTESQAWIYNFPNMAEEPVGHLMVTSYNRIHVITKQGSTYKLYSINSDTGVKVWDKTLSGIVPLSSPVMSEDGGSIYVGTAGRLYALSASNGNTLWSYYTGSDIKCTPVVGTGNLVYFAIGTLHTDFYCIDGNASASNRLIWKETVSNLRPNERSAVMDRQGRVYIGLSNSSLDDGKLVAFKGTGRPAFSDWPMWGRSLGHIGRAGAPYRTIVFDTLGGNYSVATAINKHEHVAGYAHNYFNYLRAAESDAGSPFSEVLSGTYFDCAAFGINDSGDIVGYTDEYSPRRAFHAPASGSPFTLPPLYANPSEALAVNNNLRIVGFSDNPQSVQRGVFWDYGATVAADIESLAGSGSQYSSIAYAVSSSGRITGASATTQSGQTHAFLTNPNGVIQPITDDLGDLSTYNDKNSWGYGINDAHTVVGMAQDNSSAYRAFLKELGDTMVDIGGLSGSSQNLANDINNNGLVIGQSYLSSGYRAWLKVDGVSDLYPLNNLTEYVGINDLMTAESVNDIDAIVGYGINSNYEYRGYLLRPNE